MSAKHGVLCVATVLAVSMAGSAHADAMKSNVAFNTGIGQKTASQPADGVQVGYQVTLKGGDLDGCTVDIVEGLFGRDNGAWGIFDVAGKVTCAGGGFTYTSSGSWDGKGFHGAGTIDKGSGTGSFQGISGRVAQIGGGAADGGNGTFNISYELIFDAIKA